MYLIGIIAENGEIAKVLKKEFNTQKADFINLNLDIIENFKNIKFDIILISNLEKYKKSTSFKKIISNSNIAVINADIKKNLEILDDLSGIVITYGFNSKSTITASSVNDGNISICVQRVIENLNKEKIENGEFIENINGLENIEISDIIGIKTIEVLLAKKKI